MLPSPGARFDRYRLGDMLGEGGMGKVFRAYDERLQRWVALKLLQPPPAEPAGTGSARSERSSRPTGDAGARLLREARAAAALDHPNVVAIFDVGEAAAPDDGQTVPFIAMELIEGRSLRAFIGVKEVGLAERVRWLTQVARALAAAHARGLVHRDVKPENVMIRSDGFVKVLDFGIARRSMPTRPDADTQAAGAVNTFTAAGQVVGTPFYMAPEQMRGDTIDARADQFSWGVLAYELLSGRLPWDRDGGALKVVSEVLTAEPPRLGSVASDVPAVIEALVSRTLAKAPADRLAGMDRVVETLDAFAGGAPALPSNVPEALGSAPTILSTRTSLAAVGPPAARARVKVRWGFALACGALVIVAGAGAAVYLRLRSTQPAPAVSAKAAPQPTGLVDLPKPATTPEALAAYEASMRARRDGDNMRFVQEATRAVTLDPKLAPALMRLAVNLFDFTPERAREYFSRAMDLRDSLNPRDRGFLDAYEPYVQRDPSDLPETRRRLQALAERYPMDAEIAFVLARQDDRAGDRARALEGYRRASVLDARFVLPRLSEMNLLAFEEGDLAGALAAGAACDQIAPGDPGCFGVRDLIYMRRGECRELEQDARRLMAQRPSSPLGYIEAAEAQSTSEASVAPVRELIDQARARMGEDDKAWIPVALFDVHLATLEGDFARADALLQARESSLVSAISEDVHSVDAWERAQLAFEMGKPDAARAVARAFLARRSAWTAPPSRDPMQAVFDHGVALLAIAAGGAGASGTAVDQARKAWLERWTGVADAKPYTWLVGYAEPAATHDDATAALAALPDYQPLPALWMVAPDCPIGRTYLLAGRAADAVPFLRSAIASCDAIDTPLDHVRAAWYLGKALEATGDTAGACDAYRRVLARWGSARPRSVTADGARERVAALRCAP